MADIYIDGVIVGGDTFWGDEVDARKLVREIDSLPAAESITLHVNSPGGNVMDGVAILASLQQHEGPVNARILGLAASMAAIIVESTASHISMNKGARLMIHDPHGFAFGTARDFRKLAGIMDGHGADFADWLSRRMGENRETVLALMAEETWYTSAEAVAAGLVDEEIDNQPVKGLSARGRKFASANFRKTPGDLLQWGHLRSEPGAPILYEREVETILRDAGLSRGQAKQFISLGKAALQREAGEQLDGTQLEADDVEEIAKASSKLSFLGGSNARNHAD